MARRNGSESGGFVKNNRRGKNGDKKEKKVKPFTAKAGKRKPSRPAGEGAKFVPVAPKPVVPPPDVEYEHGIIPMFALGTEFSGSKHFIIDGAKFRAEVSAFRVREESGEYKWVKFVDVTLQEVPAAPHNLSNLPESACQITLARGCIYKTKEAVSKPRGMDDQTYERKLVIWSFLHEAWKDAGEPRANNNVENPFTVIRHRLQREVPAILKSKPASQQSVFAEALAPVKEVLERAKYSSNATKFIGGEQGEYAFPKSGSVFLRMTARREIVLLGVEEGNPLFDILDRHAHTCRFTIDHLTGKTALPKEVRKDKDPLHIAIRRLCTNLREFLKPYGLMVFEQQKKAETPVRDPSREITLGQFVAGDVGRLSFEGVSLRAVDGRGNTGKPRVEVSVVAVDGQHPDYEFLVALVGKRLFISTYLIELGPDYPRDGLKGKTESELDSLEALFLLLRRAFGHQAEFMRDKKAAKSQAEEAEEAVEAIVLPMVSQTEGTPEGATVH